MNRVTCKWLGHLRHIQVHLQVLQVELTSAVIATCKCVSDLQVSEVVASALTALAKYRKNLLSAVSALETA